MDEVYGTVQVRSQVKKRALACIFFEARRALGSTLMGVSAIRDRPPADNAAADARSPCAITRRGHVYTANPARHAWRMRRLAVRRPSRFAQQPQHLGSARHHASVAT